MDIASSFTLTFTLAVVILMLKPGPFMMTCMTLALEGRWRSIVAFWSGYGVMRTGTYFFLLMTLSLLPIGFGMLFIFLKAFASLMLITMGIKGLQTAMDLEADKTSSKALQEKLQPKNFWHNFTLGALIQVSNPYDYVFILVVIPSIFARTAFTVADITSINIIVWVVDILVNCAYILPILYFQKKIYSPQLLKKVKYVTSIMLILIGLYIFSTMFFRDAMVESQLLSG
jgi:threonine/homoserine/homoserine lactone efflux protein